MAGDARSLGGAFFRLRQYDKAISALQEAIHLRPEYALAWFNLGVVCSAQGDRSEVMTVYEKLKALDQNLADDFFRKLVLP